jgi:protein-arginine kinase activator protein McsA
MTCEECRERPAELVLTYSDRCQLREKKLCRDCARTPRVTGPYVLKPAAP